MADVFRKLLRKNINVDEFHIKRGAMRTIGQFSEYEEGKKISLDDDATELRRCAEKIWNAISKYVTIEKDAIFKDPDWPHLWDKK